MIRIGNPLRLYVLVVRLMEAEGDEADRGRGPAKTLDLSSSPSEGMSRTSRVVLAARSIQLGFVNIPVCN